MCKTKTDSQTAGEKSKLHCKGWGNTASLECKFFVATPIFFLEWVDPEILPLEWVSKIPTLPRSHGRLTRAMAGPWGDENGCRAEWLAFYDQARTTSCMTSYRSNSFNSYFEPAAATIHHLDNLPKFLTNSFLGHSNTKIESMAADLGDGSLLAHVCAVAVLFLPVTGPVFQLWAVAEQCQVHWLSHLHPEDGSSLVQMPWWCQWPIDAMMMPVTYLIQAILES